ncbi:hypothetical protein B0H10DRAFT_2012555 [Mycena sp. CBHHK59/15]|nr:hypothetical protein B0H10DRAFT_2012555 [Mycena sp. CBHHK59/15]
MRPGAGSSSILFVDARHEAACPEDTYARTNIDNGDSRVWLVTRGRCKGTLTHHHNTAQCGTLPGPRDGVSLQEAARSTARRDKRGGVRRRQAALFGRPDVVVNNAGNGILTQIEATPDDAARHNFDVQFSGPVSITRREAIKILRDVNPKRHGGLVINVSSAGG